MLDETLLPETTSRCDSLESKQAVRSRIANFMYTGATSQNCQVPNEKEKGNNQITEEKHNFK